MRIVIDGTVGAGKTTILQGISQRDEEKKVFPSFREMGYPIFSDLVINVIKELRDQGIQDPSENWDLFFEIAIDHSIDYYNQAVPGTINFYDRGIFFFEIMAKRYQCVLPEKYFKFCREYRYDDPVFIFEPVLDLDMSKPHVTDNSQKVYSLQERQQQHLDIISLYKKYNYKVIEVPLMYDNPRESVDFRFKMIKEVLGI